jgi:hypothetical protein
MKGQQKTYFSSPSFFSLSLAAASSFLIYLFIRDIKHSKADAGCKNNEQLISVFS